MKLVSKDEALVGVVVGVYLLPLLGNHQGSSPLLYTSILDLLQHTHRYDFPNTGDSAMKELRLPMQANSALALDT